MLTERALGPKQQHFDMRSQQAHGAGNLTHTQVHFIPQPERRELPLWKMLPCQCPKLQGVLLGGAIITGLAGREHLGRDGGLGHGALAGACGTIEADAQPPGDGIKPCQERQPGIISAKLLVGTHECFLSQLLGVVPVRGTLEQKSKD